LIKKLRKNTFAYFSIRITEFIEKAEAGIAFFLRCENSKHEIPK